MGLRDIFGAGNKKGGKEKTIDEQIHEHIKDFRKAIAETEADLSGRDLHTVVSNMNKRAENMREKTERLRQNLHKAKAESKASSFLVMADLMMRQLNRESANWGLLIKSCPAILGKMSGMDKRILELMFERYYDNFFSGFVITLKEILSEMEAIAR